MAEGWRGGGGLAKYLLRWMMNGRKTGIRSRQGKVGMEGWADLTF